MNIRQKKPSKKQVRSSCAKAKKNVNNRAKSICAARNDCGLCWGNRQRKKENISMTYSNEWEYLNKRQLASCIRIRNHNPSEYSISCCHLLSAFRMLFTNSLFFLLLELASTLIISSTSCTGLNFNLSVMTPSVFSDALPTHISI